MSKRCKICSNPIMDEDACAMCDIATTNAEISNALKSTKINPSEDMDFTYEIRRRAREDEDSFIFETIEPYCSNIAKQKISKEDLNEAIQLWMAAKRIMHVGGK